MSLRTLITPWVSERLLSEQRMERLRRRAEAARVASGLPHEVLYFHQVDDPYSHLAAQGLRLLVRRYDIRVRPVLVGPPADSAAPDRARLVDYSRVDAQRLARWRGLEFHDPQRQPGEAAVARASLSLLESIERGDFLERVVPQGTLLWAHAQDGAAPADPLLPQQARRLAVALQEGDRLRTRLGHYLGATFFYGGEWYWGVDRLYHLERRLQELGAARGDGDAQGMLLFPPDADLGQPAPAAGAPDIDFFFSLRSPYSAIVAPRVFALGRRTGARVRLRFVLPMVMRGLAVPAEKRRYISLDAAREARERGIPFGRLNDPVGRPTERGLSLIPWAERAGRGQDYVLAFMHGVWAQGLDAGSDAGLRRIVEVAGLSWDEARVAMKDEAWRVTAEANRRELLDLGLWGVPSFRVGDFAAWGQDRLGMVQAAVMNPSKTRPVEAQR